MARLASKSNPRPSGHQQGSTGGMNHKGAARPGQRPMILGDEAYLWALVLIEIGVISYLRRSFRRYHGG